ncbi:[FeFe] hydrogenase H-cluster radical SAM maturase HydG [Megalodesulfovibrio paquesii]
MKSSETASWLDEAEIATALEGAANPEPTRVQDILQKSLELKGLDFHDVAVLSHVQDPAQLQALFDTARRVKEAIYGRRLVLFAPLYISNHCGNECLYCAFRRSNTALNRRALSQEEIRRETEILVEQGHKRVLLVAGESYPGAGLDYIYDAIRTIYDVKNGSGGEIRRINVNIAPLTTDQFRTLKETGIGTYQLFQETYHRATYARVHVAGVKKDYDWRATAIDRAMEAGIDDVGLGVLFGLADWRFDLLGIMSHIRHLEQRFDVGCHTVSVPRIEPACGSDMASAPPHAVSDTDFLKITAILRLAVPYTGIIMSTRENAETRRATLELGVSQISAGSRTNPGGYAESLEQARDEDAAQFQLGDHRSLEEVVRDISALGYIPSFCTACYRLGRTGHDFMDMAKPGLIKEKCGPNALSTFLEYLLDYTAADTRDAGLSAIDLELADMDGKVRKLSERMIERVHAGKRDVFC